MDTTLKIAFVAAISAVIGGLITGVIAPHVAWGIEKRRGIREARKSILKGAENLIADYRRDGFAGNGLLLGKTIQTNTRWIRIKPYVTKSIRNQIQELKSQPMNSEAVSKLWTELEDDIVRLRAKWKLV